MNFNRARREAQLTPTPLSDQHWTGTAHRNRLIKSGQYIKTSQPPGMGLMQFIRGPLPEYKPKGPMYPPPHHRGSAADVEHHWPGCGHE